MAWSLQTNKHLPTLKLHSNIQHRFSGIQTRAGNRFLACSLQTDKHLPTLTVRETCDFARDCTTGSLVTDESHREDLAKLAGPWGKHMKTEVSIQKWSGCDCLHLRVFAGYCSRPWPLQHNPEK
jgi:hypothetical protein